jgi:hypothetical protein
MEEHRLSDPKRRRADTWARVGPVACAAITADGSQMLVALIRCPRESFEQLLDRLDAALRKYWDDDVRIDEIND